MSARPNRFRAFMGLLAVVVLLPHFSATGFALAWDADVPNTVGLEPVAESPDGLLWRFNARIVPPDYAPAALRTGRFAGDALWETTIELPAG